MVARGSNSPGVALDQDPAKPLDLKEHQERLLGNEDAQLEL